MQASPMPLAAVEVVLHRLGLAGLAGGEAVMVHASEPATLQRSDRPR
ncbi:MAG: hypothetical protein R6W93_03995 [Candidatus Limnocylindrales bacterium]